MPICSQCTARAWRARIIRSVIAVLILALPLPAFAGLGASVESVQQDQVHMQAKLVVSDKQRFRVQELTSPLGVVVREYVSPSGRIFAVAWQGHFMPPMRELLGSYFGQYSRAVKEQQSGRIRRALVVIEPSLVVQSLGHLREYSGRAYDPTLLPSGVSADDLQ